MCILSCCLFPLWLWLQASVTAAAFFTPSSSCQGVCVWGLCAGIGRAPRLGFSFAQHWQQMPEEENASPLRLRTVNVEAPALTDLTYFPTFKCILQAPLLSPLCKFLIQTPLRVPLYAILSSSSLSLFNSFFYQLPFKSAVLSATYSSCAGCISWCWLWPRKGKSS